MIHIKIHESADGEFTVSIFNDAENEEWGSCSFCSKEKPIIEVTKEVKA